MPRSFWSRAFVLVLLLVLATPAFAALSREPAEPAVRGAFSFLWQALAKLVFGTGEGSGTVDLVDGSGNESGPGMDPNG